MKPTLMRVPSSSSGYSSPLAGLTVKTLSPFGAKEALNETASLEIGVRSSIKI